MTRLAPGWEWSPSGRARRIRDWVAPDRLDPRLQQDMEAELAADVEWYDHPAKGRIRLVDELVHPPDTFKPLPPVVDASMTTEWEDEEIDADDWDYLGRPAVSVWDGPVIGACALDAPTAPTDNDTHDTGDSCNPRSDPDSTPDLGRSTP